MKTGEIIHGFKFIRSRELADISATLHEAVYEKNGASLLFIEREDTNKTFAITFKTIPEDSTGVFHIIEHSVLCGSEKYPVKEPFVALLKGSLKTFLNAFTFPDKTMYPVSSRDDKDFLNLVGVYMDAVLHPLARKNPNIFYQEGWHHEIHDKDEPLTYKGVVFNEMKGAYSSVDELEMEYITAMLCPDNCYGKDSGGDPSVIPSLTYEQFCESHARYYHPSNSKIILDGKQDLDKTLALLDSYLKDYEKLDICADIPNQKPLGEIFAKKSFEIGPDEDAEGKCRVVLGFAAGSYREQEKNLAIKIITDAIAGSNEAPFKRAMLASGLCEDVSLTSYDGVQENAFLIEIKNVKEENLESAEKLARDTIKDIVTAGIDKEALTASLNIFEFRAREQDGSYYPLGISYAMAALDTWLYGGDPADGLAFEESFANLRRALDGRYYEELLSDIVLDSKHCARLYMYPDKSLGEKREAEIKAALEKEKAALTEDQLEEKIALTKALEEWQKMPDSPESLATLPRLDIADVSDKVEDFGTRMRKYGDSDIVFTPAESRGISYSTFVFDITDFNENEVFMLSLAASLLKNVATENYTTEALQTKIKSSLGSLGFTVGASTKAGKVHTYLSASVSALEANKNLGSTLACEVLLRSKFEDKAAIGKIIRQAKIGMKEAFSSFGHQIALTRASARINAEAAVTEYTDGVEFYKRICALDESFEENSAQILAEFKKLIDRATAKERLAFIYAANEDDAFAESSVDLFPSIPYEKTDCPIKALGRLNEGIAVPAQVTFSASVGNVLDHTDFLSGHLIAARTILSFGYLWNEIRVMGGAYGTGFLQRPSGIAGFYSYRDPDSARSLGKYRETPAFLRTLAASGADLTEFLIGALGDSDPLITPKLISALSVAYYMNGTTYEDRAKRRRQLISTSHADLENLADLIDKMMENGSFCVVGPRAKLEECGVDDIIEIN